MSVPVWKAFMAEAGVRQLRELVRASLAAFQKEADEPELYRELVRIGRQRAKNVSLKAYGAVLAEEGLSAPRVSEVRRILSVDEVATKFLAKELGVSDALQKAREPRRASGKDKSPQATKPNPTVAATIWRQLDALAFLFQRRAQQEACNGDGILRDPAPVQIGVFLFRYYRGDTDLAAQRNTQAKQRKKVRRERKMVEAFLQNAERATVRIKPTQG